MARQSLKAFQRERAAWRAVVARGMSLAGWVADSDPEAGIDRFLNYWDLMDGSCSVARWFGEAYLYARTGEVSPQW